MTDKDTADDRGYQFATFRSHALHRWGSWTLPGVRVDELPERKGWHRCACGADYQVRHDYHFHSWNGICHNLVRCK